MNGVAEDSAHPQAKDGTKQKPRDKLSFLHDQLDHFIKDFKQKRNYSRDRVGTFTLVSISSGSILTILLGLKSIAFLKGFEDWTSAIALIMSAAITGLNSWIAFADYKWKWIRYRATLSTLYTIRDDLRYLEVSGQPVSDEELDKIYDQLKRAVHETNEEWMSQRGNAISGLGAGKNASK